MKKMIRVNMSKPVWENIEVELPTYMMMRADHDDGGWFELYVRVHESGTVAHFLKVDDEGEWEFKAVTDNIGQFVRPDSSYGRVEPRVFYDKLGELRAALTRVSDMPCVGVPDALGFALARCLRAECRDFHFGQIIESGSPRGIYILTRGHTLSDVTKASVRALVLKHGMPDRTMVEFYSREERNV